MNKTNINFIMIATLFLGSVVRADTLLTCPEALHFTCAKKQSFNNESTSVCTASEVSDQWTFVAPDHQELSVNKPLLKNGNTDDPHRSDSNLDAGDYTVRYSLSYSGSVRELSGEVAYCIYWGSSKSAQFMAGLYNKDYHHDQSPGWKPSGEPDQYICQGAVECGFISNP